MPSIFKIFSNHFKLTFLIPIFSNLVSRILWSTRSEALRKSRKIPTTISLLLKHQWCRLKCELMDVRLITRLETKFILIQYIINWQYIYIHRYSVSSYTDSSVWLNLSVFDFAVGGAWTVDPWITNHTR